jgi:hypothetical protein
MKKNCLTLSLAAKTQLDELHKLNKDSRWGCLWIHQPKNQAKQAKLSNPMVVK